MELTKKYFIDLLTKRSVLLNPPSKDPKERPTRHFSMIAGLNGLENYQNSLLHNVEIKGELKLSKLNFAKLQLKESKERWAKFNASQMHKKQEPVGHFAERINKAAAKIEVFQAESRMISKILKEANAKKAEQERVETEAKAAGPFPRLIGKIKDGQLSEMDGKKIIDGIFEDGTSVKAYVEAGKVKRMKYFEQKEAEEAEALKIKLAMMA